ncbi:ABC transporter ATP-binding protein [Glycomyces endophyticus]|uniref:ABC transporter ATP-binding protein n=1 Tax=Glycomyces endophyticus TaxID=480996 RepID=A0ABP4TKB7_9ACTN
MRQEFRYAASGLSARAVWALLAWSALEILPTAVFGLMLARAVDEGFLAGRPWTGAAWLGGVLLAAAVGALGAARVYAALGAVVEPFRDRLVRQVVRRSLAGAAAGRPEPGALSLLTRQVEIARDAYAGIVVSVRGCLVTTVGVTAGLLALDARLAALVLPPFFLGLMAFTATLGFAAGRQRAAAEADADLTDAAGRVAAAARDLAAAGGEAYGEAFAAGPIAAQRKAERALAGAAALRTLCFAVGGWLPLLVLLVAAPRLLDQGVTAGALTGALLYILTGLQPALSALISGLGSSGLRLYVALTRIRPDTGRDEVAEADPEPGPLNPLPLPDPPAPVLAAHGLTFAYGPRSTPAVEDLEFAVGPGEHLAIVGPSGVGKSTLAALLCGLLRPDRGGVAYSGDDAAQLSPRELARRRVLLPQGGYVFTATVRENLAYLHPGATDEAIAASAAAVGATGLVDRLGGLDALLAPRDLSSGERQILALARAHLSPAPVAILDEATCHLDPAAEARAERAFAERGTLIVIAHRPSSALRAERVLVLDGGTAVLGDREMLQGVSPLFRVLMAHQSGGATP